MLQELKPIIITPEQIIAAARKIVDGHVESGFNFYDYTADEYLAATEHWLRTTVNALLRDADGQTGLSNSGFTLDTKCFMPRCDRPALPDSNGCEYHTYYRGDVTTAKELVMPEAPEWIQKPTKDDGTVWVPHMSPTGWNEDSRFYGVE